jgi:hypothetical protein
MSRLVLTLILAALLVAPGLNAVQEPEKEREEQETRAGGTPAEAAEESAENLEDLTVPAKPHEVLAGTVGEWSLAIRVWSAPEGEPTETTGTATGRWILGERFVETTYQGEVMGRPFEALKIEGYEKVKEHYLSTWRDNLGTYTLIFEGACGDDCSKRTMIASFQDPISKQQLRIKGLTTLTGDDSYSYESYILMPDGSEFKNMELLAERRSQ